MIKLDAHFHRSQTRLSNSERYIRRNQKRYALESLSIICLLISISIALIGFIFSHAY